MKEANDWASNLNGERYKIECCSVPIIAEPCMRKKCDKSPLSQDKSCKNKPLIQQKAGICTDGNGVTKYSNTDCQSLKQSWKTPVMVSVIVLVIIATAVLIYIVYTRKFSRKHKHKGAWSFGDNPNVDAHAKKSTEKKITGNETKNV